jgi:GNAT superfamily N-acetyltransferase
MKLWKMYIKEREGAEMLYDDHSFVTYQNIGEGEILVVDVFIESEYRKKGLAEKLWKELLEKAKPKIVYGMTDVEALNWETSHKFMLSFGFTPYTQEGNTIYYYQEIK